MDVNKDSKDLALYYMKVLADTARESFLILDSDLRVLSANPVFYQNFQVTAPETENIMLYDLGNGQWNIPQLKKLLEEILPKKKDVRDYEVKHLFETIGEKTIVLNARQLDHSQLIVLAMEDITVRKDLEERLKIIAKQLAAYSEGLENEVAKRTEELKNKVKELESINGVMIDREIKMVGLKKEIVDLKTNK